MCRNAEEADACRCRQAVCGKPLFTLAGEALRSRICCSGLCGQCSSRHHAQRVDVVVLEQFLPVPGTSALPDYRTVWSGVFTWNVSTEEEESLPSVGSLVM